MVHGIGAHRIPLPAYRRGPTWEGCRWEPPVGYGAEIRLLPQGAGQFQDDGRSPREIPEVALGAAED